MRSEYVGYHKNGVKHGEGKYKWADGSEFSGNWINGNIDGYVSSIGNLQLVQWGEIRRRLEG